MMDAPRETAPLFVLRSSVPRSPVLLALLMGVLGLLAGCGAAHSEATQPAVATVAGEPFTLAEFEQRYTNYLTKTGLQDTPRIRIAYLEHLVDVKLIAHAAASEKGLADEPAYQHEMERTRRKLLLDAYAEQVIFAGVDVTEADLRAMFERINTQATARHLYARTREQADALKARLDAGERFEDLAREVFADPELAESGGHLGTFGFDEMDPALEEVAFTQPIGEVSEPVRTAFGYSLVEVLGRTTTPLMTEAQFAEKRGQLRTFVRDRKRTQAQFDHSSDLVQTLVVELHDDAVARLFAQIQGAELMPEGEEEAAWLQAPLATFGPAGDRTTWTVADFREHAQYTGEEQRAKVGTEAHLRSFIQGLVVQQAMIERAEDARLDTMRAYQRGLAHAREVYLHGRAVDGFRAATEVPADSVRAYYEANRATYTAPAQVRVWEILSDTKADAEQVKAQLSEAPFEALARQYSTRPGADASGGDLGFVTREQLGLLDGPVFDASPGDVLGPLEVAGRYVLLKVGEKKPSRPATFDEARPEIETLLREAAMRRDVRAHVAELRERYDVTVHGEVLASLRLDQ